MKAVLTGLMMATAALSASATTIDMMDARTGEPAGTVVIENSSYGLVFTPSLTGLQPGGHGFHVHENPSCESAVKNGDTVPAGAAGSHYDPQQTDNHGYPWSDDAHLGDLPLLYVNEEGDARHSVLAPRLTVEKVTGRALMVHEEGDNYSDEPAKLGGGGPRVLCGIIR
ncbi:superoxide dismutase family protein [Alteromonas sp. ASW11-19]|uniref:Superoxide dismutase family protein n=1 Tax=Alteromonas salexigens TaxID=2982530 RepID=A0ABT2VK97_9ALTE|nr:superoxide dismutase family protein [Alteromonas salexigens]MCU7553238.1 superoxide dismutase family protein [Alteromonas salexigens]